MDVGGVRFNEASGKQLVLFDQSCKNTSEDTIKEQHVSIMPSKDLVFFIHGTLVKLKAREPNLFIVNILFSPEDNTKYEIVFWFLFLSLYLECSSHNSCQILIIFL